MQFIFLIHKSQSWSDKHKETLYSTVYLKFICDMDCIISFETTIGELHIQHITLCSHQRMMTI